MKANNKQLSWWSRGDNENCHWSTGQRGRYVIVRVTVSDRNIWNVDHRRGPSG
jgi:hypothetical protein